jgi:hypothetical protein
MHPPHGFHASLRGSRRRFFKTGNKSRLLPRKIPEAIPHKWYVAQVSPILYSSKRASLPDLQIRKAHTRCPMLTYNINMISGF